MHLYLYVNICKQVTFHTYICRKVNKIALNFSVTWKDSQIHSEFKKYN